MPQINFAAQGHLRVPIGHLLNQGWTIQEIPAGGRLVRNGQAIILRLPGRDVRLRLFVYKITISSRGRPEERRIEITSTYQKGLRRRIGFQDVVLGWDQIERIYVGVDPRRVSHGGPTGNASSFFDKAGLDWRRQSEISVRARYTRLFPSKVEFHAFFRPKSLAEYLLNLRAIHSNSYTGGPRLSIRRRRTGEALRKPLERGEVVVLAASAMTLARHVSRDLVEIVNSGELRKLRSRHITPEEFAAIQRECEANGQLGERWVLDLERRALRRIGKHGLAAKVQWVSQKSVSVGYDIGSFYPDGREKWIEVKSTSGRGITFPMSSNEWTTALRAGGKYHVYRVTDVKSKRPRVKRFANLASLEKRGLIKRSPSGWLVTLR